MKRIIVRLFLFMLMVLSHACSGELGEFQKNVPDPDFVLFDMFKNEPALDEIWDVLDQAELNEKLAEMIKANKEDFVVFSRINRDLMEDAAIFPGLMKDSRVMINLIRTIESRFMDTRAQGSFYDESPSEYRRIMYALTDRLRRDNGDKGMTESILSMARKVTSYMTDTKTPEMLQADMSDLVESINDLERDDFILLTKNIGKVMAAASYPMYIRTTEFSSTGDGKFGVLETDYDDMLSYSNSGLGNAVKGTHSLLTGLKDFTDPAGLDRDMVYDAIRDIRGTVLKKENSEVIKDFIYTLEKYFTAGGSVYGNANTTNKDIDSNLYNTNSPDLYSDAELTNTLKEIFGLFNGIFLRDDRPGAMTRTDGSKGYMLERLSQRLRDTGIDWKNAKIEESLYDIMVIDPYGRDRTKASGFDGRKPYAISFLEDFFFLGGIANNFGWKEGGSKNEVSGSSEYSAVCNAHGHGDPVNFITVNDMLFSMTSKRFMEMLGIYELVFADSARQDHIYRSCRPFSKSSSSNYKMYFNTNYCAFDFIAGCGVGDMGLPDGGNVNGVSGSPEINSYRPYCGNGIDEKGLGGYVLGWIARACFEGEGPYYYKDPDAGTKSLNGKMYYRYMRPNGRTYAYVHYNGSGGADSYLYPAEGNDPVDQLLVSPECPQRENRFQSSWRTDYFMITNTDGSKFYTLNNMNGDAGGPDSIVYNELIDEYEPMRECSSKEEAIYRNYQWVMTEKKCVMVVPMWIKGKALGIFPVEAAAYMIAEANGVAGVSPARKYRANRVWAKANCSGVSKIPGDYRIDLRVKSIKAAAGIIDVDEPMVYDNILGNGSAVYSVAFHALASAYRFGFPRSQLLDESAYAGYGDISKMNFNHYMLGSKQFAVGDDTWQKRNTILPLLGAVISVLHESATPEKKTVANFTDSLMPFIKPLFFFNRDISGGVCSNSFLPRIQGGATDITYKYNHSKALIPDSFISGFSNSETDPYAWFGGWAVSDYYMASPMTTLLSGFIDRTGIVQGNPDGNRDGRAKGIIPLFTKYNIDQPRSDSNQSPTRIVSQLIEKFVELSDSKYNDKSGISYSAENFDNTEYINWGARRRILYGFEQIVSSMKISKPPYIEKLQDRSKGTDVAKGGTATKMQRIPEWIFQQRDVDIDMNSILSRIIGFDDPDGFPGPLAGKGLAAYPDDKPDYIDWADFDDSIEDMADLADNLFMKGSPYNITGNMLDVADCFLKKNISDDEAASLLHSTGRLFAWHNGNRWVWQGDEEFDTPDNPDTDFAFMWRMVKNYIPMIHKKISPDGNPAAGGENYMAMLKIISYAMKDEGLVSLVMDVSLSADTEELVDDIYEFLGEDFVTGGGAMWMTLADLMDDLADNVEGTTPETVADLYSDYGFQQNGY